MASNVMRIPRTGGGEWEMVRDSKYVVRYRKVGDLAWSFLTPWQVAELNAAQFGV